MSAKRKPRKRPPRALPSGTTPGLAHRAKSSEALRRTESGRGKARTLLDDWLAGKAGPTQLAYRSDIRLLGCFTGLDAEALDENDEIDELLLEELTVAGLLTDAQSARETLVQWRSAMLRRKLSPHSVNRRLSTVRSLIAHAFEAGKIGWEARVKAAKAKARALLPPAPGDTFDDVIAELNSAAEDDPLAARDLCILLLMHDTGLRRGSVVSMDVEHVRLGKAGGTIMFKEKNKGDEYQSRTINERQAIALDLWLQHRGRNPGALFTSIAGERGRPSAGLSADTINDISHGYGLGPPHGIRRLAATRLATLGNPYLVQALLGHASVKTGQSYVDDHEDRPGQAARFLGGEEMEAS